MPGGRGGAQFCFLGQQLDDRIPDMFEVLPIGAHSAFGIA